MTSKVTAFIRFKHRFYGEYAREAMQNQSILGNEVITIKWAYEDPNPQANKLKNIEEEQRFLKAYRRKMVKEKKAQDQKEKGAKKKKTETIQLEADSNADKLTKVLERIDTHNP